MQNNKDQNCISMQTNKQASGKKRNENEEVVKWNEGLYSLNFYTYFIP